MADDFSALREWAFTEHATLGFAERQIQVQALLRHCRKLEQELRRIATGDVPVGDGRAMARVAQRALEFPWQAGAIDGGIEPVMPPPKPLDAPDKPTVITREEWIEERVRRYASILCPSGWHDEAHSSHSSCPSCDQKFFRPDVIHTKRQELTYFTEAAERYANAIGCNCNWLCHEERQNES